MILTEKEYFHWESFKVLKEGIEGISLEEANDIYIISFFYYWDENDLRFPSITLGYNTETHFVSQIHQASDAQEARWNSAFWLLNNIAKVGGKECELLKAWFNKTLYYFSDEQNEKSRKDKSLYEEILKKENDFNEEFIEMMIFISKKMFSKGIIRQKFGRNIPIIIHNFQDYHWTLLANEQEILTDFLNYYGDEYLL